MATEGGPDPTQLPAAAAALQPAQSLAGTGLQPPHVATSGGLAPTQLGPAAQVAAGDDVDLEEDDFGLDDVDTALHAHNRGDAPAYCGPCVRWCVSKKKRRFRGPGVDLDLSYITNRVIAMGYPSSGIEAVYRNPADEVKSFFSSRHPDHYRIWNLCSEREYGAGSFKCEVERFAWADHTPPPLAMVRRHRW